MLPAQCIAFDLQAAKMLKSSQEFVVGTAAICNLHGANGQHGPKEMVARFVICATWRVDHISLRGISIFVL